MTTLLKVKNYISNLMGHVTFDYNGYSCGIDPLSLDSFDMWYGDKETTVDSVKKAFTIKFFDGKSLTEIWDDVTEINL